MTGLLQVLSRDGIVACTVVWVSCVISVGAGSDGMETDEEISTAGIDGGALDECSGRGGGGTGGGGWLVDGMAIAGVEMDDAAAAAVAEGVITAGVTFCSLCLGG